MTRPVRVAHVITKLAVGGAQESALVTCEGLDPTRFEQVLFTGVEEDAEGTMFAEAERRGVEVRLAPELVRPIRPFQDRRAVAALARRFEHAGADLVHTHSSKAGLVGRLAARRAGLAVVHSVHGWSFNDDMDRRLRAAVVAAERAAARTTDVLVVEATPDLAKGLAAGIGPEGRYRLIRNGIDLSSLAADPAGAARFRAELAIPAEAPLVGTIGRLADQKDPLAMVAAMAEVVAARPEVFFAWVGDGPLRGEVAAAVDAAGLTGRFVLAGVRRDVAAALTAFDVFALSSRWEGLPRTVTEAMAVGTPVAATAVDGCAEIIVDGEHGLLVPSMDPGALAAAVGRLLDHPALATKVVDAAATRVQAWDRRTMLAQIADLYDEVLARRGGPRG